MKQRIGIYPGTFDPLHAGHIAFAEASLRICNLDTVYFLPEPKPRNKPQATEITVRTILLRQALTQTPNLRIFSPKSERFTVSQTLPELTAAYPNATFVMLVGSDVFKNIVHWDNLAMLAQALGFTVGLRNDDTVEDIDTVARQISKQLGIHMHYKVIHVPGTRHLSSTAIREQKER